MQYSKLLVLTLTASMLTACQQGGPPNSGVTSGGSPNKQDIGTVAGAIAGGVAGYQFGGGAGKAVATVAGTLLGGWIGSEVGKSLDNADLAAYNHASQHALETGQPGQTLPWSNPRSGVHGTVTPSNYYQNAAGYYCREYTQTIVVGGRREEGYGRACRQPDGSWKVVQ